MKRILLALALLWAALASAQTCATWCAPAPLMSGSSVVIGGAVVITASFTSAAADAGVTLATVVYDPAGNQVAKGWQTASFTAGQTITATPVVYQPLAGAPIGTYTVSLGVYEAGGAQDLWINSTATFTVTAPVASVPSSCYPPNAVNLTVALQPPAFTDWLVASNPSFVITWFCPSSTDPSGYAATAIWGYRSELLPNWPALISGSKVSLDSLWRAASTGNPDSELAPLAQAQETATRPQPLKTTGTTVYYVIQQPDKYVAVPVGNVPIGTICNQSQSVDGMYGVAAASVTWYGNVKPVAVVAPCM